MRSVPSARAGLTYKINTSLINPSFNIIHGFTVNLRLR